MNNALARLGEVRIEVLTTDTADKTRRLSREEKDIWSPYPIVFLRRVGRGDIAPAMLWRMVPMARWADVVHLTATYSFPTIPALMLCRLLRKPLVWSLHGALLYDLNRHQFDPQAWYKRAAKQLWLFLCRGLVERAGVAIHVTTEQELQASVGSFPRARFLVIPNGVELPVADLANRPRSPEDHMRLIFVGRLVPAKGVENLLRAVASLGPDVSLRLYGAGDDEYGRTLRGLAKTLELRERAVFMGHVDGAAKSRAFFNADVCVVPSYSENFCLVVAEALAHGVPVIVSNRLGWQRVEEKGCGWAVANDPYSLARAVEEAKGADLRQMGIRGRRWMELEYTEEEIARKFNGIYADLVESGC